jgi:hypothetical protein
MKDKLIALIKEDKKRESEDPRHSEFVEKYLDDFGAIKGEDEYHKDLGKHIVKCWGGDGSTTQYEKVLTVGVSTSLRNRARLQKLEDDA